MEKLNIGGVIETSAVALGCMRIGGLEEKQLDALMDAAQEGGITLFDHADIYGRGKSEEVFGSYLSRHAGVREQIYIQSKCAIHDGRYDFSKAHILKSVDGILSRLGVEYLDVLLLHRPDTLMQPCEVAEAFDRLERSGKVRHFGVSNHNAMQIELLKTAVKQPLIINQLQFSLTEAGLVSSGMNVNMNNASSSPSCAGLLEYSRIKNMTIQAWSPFQYGFFEGCYIDDEKYPKLNAKLAEVAERYGVTKTGIATAWILRHPANMQVIAGTTNPKRIAEICKGADINITGEEWYEIYRAAGHEVP